MAHGRGWSPERWSVPWEELRDLATRVEQADAENSLQNALRQAREAYDESKERGDE